jgi:hypothetical protein
MQRAKEETINEAIIIGREEGDLHELKGRSEAAMTHAIEEPWHRRLADINYKALP